MDARLAGLELGGTKAIAVLGDGLKIIARETFPTTTPGETLGRVAECLRSWNAEEPIAAAGIASFGPVRVDPAAADYGRILATTKPGWEGADPLGAVRGALGCPVALDTDVNGAALAEHALGAAQGCTSAVYLTIGTGLGGGVLVEGLPVHGAVHPEIGHVRLRRAQGDGFAGNCLFHGDCIEGLIAGPALAARFGCPPAQVPEDDPRWDLVAHDLAELLATLLMALSPQRIVLGGGVTLRQPHLLPRALEHVPAKLGGYLSGLNGNALREIVVLAGLGDDAGPLGALVLAKRALERG